MPAAPVAESLEVQFRSICVPQNTAPTLAQGRAGFIWVTTSRGLMRDDGYRLRPIEQPGESNSQRNLGWVRALSPGVSARRLIQGLGKH